MPQWRPITKRTLDLFGRWGDPRTNLRSMLDSILPVVVVDTFRDDDQGSIFGISWRGSAPDFRVASVNFGSIVNDWELLQVTAISHTGTFTPSSVGVQMFTPIFPYNPVEVNSPSGFVPTGLLLNRNFTLGTVTAIGGNAASGSFPWGPFVVGFGPGFSNNEDLMFKPLVFDPPIRVYRDTTLSFQWVGAIVRARTLYVSILYRERPKVTQR